MLEIHVINYKPQTPTTHSPNNVDYVANCTGKDCGIKMNANYSVGPMDDGYQVAIGCNSSRIVNRTYIGSSYTVWRWAAGTTGNENNLYWDKDPTMESMEVHVEGQ